MFIKQLHRHIYDVFLGKGFDNWSRVKRNHYGLSVTAGNRLPHSVLRQLTSHIK
jgi:hypothetical protein